MNHYLKVFAFVAISVVAQTQASDVKAKATTAAAVVKAEVTPSRVARMAASVKAAPFAVGRAVKSALITVTVTPTVATYNFVTAHKIATSATLVAVAAAAVAVYAYKNMQSEDTEDNE